MSLPPDATLDSTFRCAKWACTLALKHCLRRQTEVTRSSGKDGWKNARPMHAFCASGECEQGNEIRQRFPPATPTTQVNRSKPPRLDIVAAVEERTMPRGRRAEPCPHCGTTAICCAPTCVSRGGKGKPAAVKAPAPKVSARPAKRRADDMDRDLVADSSTADLLAMRAAIDDELRARLGRAEQELRAVREAVGSHPAVAQLEEVGT